MVRWPRRGGTSGQTIISNIDCNGLEMDDDGFLYVSNTADNHIKRWCVGDTTGTVAAGGNGRSDRLDQLNDPYYIFVDQNQSVYISDNKNHRVMKWAKKKALLWRVVKVKEMILHSCRILLELLLINRILSMYQTPGMLE